MKLKKILSFVLPTVIFVVLVRNIAQNWQIIVSFPWHFNGLDFILLLLFLFPIYLINGSSWFLVLRALGNKIGYFISIRIWLFANTSRFIPGVIWQYGGRVYLSSKAGVPASVALNALLVEALFVLMTSSIIALIIFTFWHYPTDIKFFEIAVFVLSILIILILLFNNQKTMNKIATIYQRITGKKGEIKSFRLSPLWIAILSISYLLQFIFAGSVLFFLTRQIVNLDWSLYAISIGIFAASWLLGYIAIIAPAGLGVQEISIATMLSSYIPFPIASIIAILFRVVILLMEATTILFVSTIFKRRLE